MRCKKQKEEFINNYPLRKAIELEELRKENEQLKELIQCNVVVREVINCLNQRSQFKRITKEDAYNELIKEYGFLNIRNLELTNELNSLKRIVELHNKKLLSRKIKI